MANLTKQQVAEIVKNRPEGTSPEEIVSGLVAKGHTLEGFAAKPADPLDVYLPKSTTANSTAQAISGGETGLGNFGRAAIRTPMRIVSGLQSGAETAIAAVSPNFSLEDVQRRNVEGRNYGNFGKNVQPFGYQASELSLREKSGEDIGVGDVFKTGGRMLADAGGGTAEIASYGIAPMPVKGAGFMSFLKATAAASGLVAASSVGQSIDQGDGAGETVARAGGAYIATTASFGVLRFAGNLFRNYGGRLVADDIVKQKSAQLNTTIEGMVKSDPELFNSLSRTMREEQANIVSENSRYWNQKYTSDMEQVRDASIKALLPQVENEQLATHNLFLALGKQSANDFQGTVKPLYDAVRNDTTRTQSTPLVDKAFDGILQKYGLEVNQTGRVIPSQTRMREMAQSGIAGQADMSMQNMVDFADMVYQAKQKGLTIADVLSQMENSQVYLAPATKAQAADIRNIVDAMRNDVRNLLPKETVDQWDLAYNSWQRATTIYDNPTINQAKDSGFADYYVDAIMSMKPSPERDVLLNTFTNVPKETQDLLVHTVMKRASERNLEDSHKYLSDFLEATRSRGGTPDMLTPEQRKMLESFREFTGQDFRTARADVMKHLGLTDEQYLRLSEGKERINIYGEISKGGYDEIATNFNKLVVNEPQRIKALVSDFDDAEKNAFGAMILEDLMQKNNRSLIPDPANPAFLKVNDSWYQDYENTYLAIKNAQSKSGSETLHGLFSPEEVVKFDEIFTEVQQLQAVAASQNKTNRLQVVVTAAQALMYAKLTYIPGAVRSTASLTNQLQNKNALPAREVEELLSLWLKEGKMTGNETTPQVFDMLSLHYYGAPFMGNTTEEMLRGNE